MSAEILIRPATEADVAGIAEVHVQSWHATYPGILPAAEIERHTPARRVGMWARVLVAADQPSAAVLVAARGGQVLGFASIGAFRVEPAEAAADASSALAGELNALYLRPNWQRQGIGRRLFHATFASLRSRGFAEMRCWVLDANPAIAFYKRMGGERVASKTFTVEGASVAEHCYRFDLA